MQGWFLHLDLLQNKWSQWQCLDCHPIETVWRYGWWKGKIRTLRDSVGSVKYSFWLQHCKCDQIINGGMGTGPWQSLCLSVLYAFLVRENAKFVFWNLHKDSSGINILDLHVTFSSKRKKKQKNCQPPSLSLKISLWCISLRKPARLFNTFVAWSWELDLLFTDPSPVTGHDHISAYIIPSRFSSTRWFKNQSRPRSIISVPFVSSTNLPVAN